MSPSYYPLVSVVIPTYNRKIMLKKAIDSVLIQDYENIEVIVSDNASTDGTNFMMEGYCKKYSHIKYIRHSENIGAVQNGYRAYQEVSGKYCMILCDDDYLGDRTFFSEAIAVMETNDKVAFVRGIVISVDQNESIFSVPNFYHSRKLTKGIEFYINYQCPGYEHIDSFFALVRKQWVDKSGIMNMNPPGLDHWLWSILCLYGDVYFLPKIIGYYREHSVNKESESIDFAMNFDYVCDMVTWISDQAIIMHPEYQSKILEQRCPNIEAAEILAFYINILKRYKPPKEIKNIIGKSNIIQHPEIYHKLMEMSGLKNGIIKKIARILNKILNKFGLKIVRIKF